MLQSSIAWIDFSEQDRRKMMEVVALFKQRDTRDELGLGSNRVVLSAAGMVEPFLESAHYLMIIPSDRPEDDLKLLKKAAHHPAVKLTVWDPSIWGILPWQRVFDFCRQEQLQHALDVSSTRASSWPRAANTNPTISPNTRLVQS